LSEPAPRQAADEVPVQRVRRMISAGAQVRNRKAAEYLQLLKSLAAELERAMQAIALNALPDLEESVASQQVLSARLTELVNEICVPLQADPSASQARLDESVMLQIRAESDTLQKLNQRYAALLQHSSRSVALMTALFSSVNGQLKEASGPRLKYQTWSCQM
jgi:23S rRNA A2030 N6-methylase RlmJ